jgi:hypothetical protein
VASPQSSKVSSKAPPSSKAPASSSGSGSSSSPAASKAAAGPPDPFSPQNRRQLAIRLGIPLLVGWVIAIAIPGWLPKAIAGVVTLVAVGLLVWAVRYASKAKAVAAIVQGAAQTKEGRKEALEKLESQFKKDDVAATFAKAQLQMQEDPRAALKTLEVIDLGKVMAPVADEARAQRAMIHLILGETDDAKTLVEPIDLTRHKEPRTRATLTAIIGEAWARSGQAKRAVELLDKLDDKDPAYVEIQPQLLRARAFAHAWANDTKAMRGTLKRLGALNVQYLMGFITKKKNPMGVAPRGVHPLLEKEAFDMLMKSGAVPRRTEMRRH